MHSGVQQVLSDIPVDPGSQLPCQSTASLQLRAFLPVAVTWLLPDAYLCGIFHLPDPDRVVCNGDHASPNFAPGSPLAPNFAQKYKNILEKSEGNLQDDGKQSW